MHRFVKHAAGNHAKGTTGSCPPPYRCFAPSPPYASDNNSHGPAQLTPFADDADNALQICMHIEIIIVEVSVHCAIVGAHVHAYTF